MMLLNDPLVSMTTLRKLVRGRTSTESSAGRASFSITQSGVAGLYCLSAFHHGFEAPGKFKRCPRLAHLSSKAIEDGLRLQNIHDCAHHNQHLVKRQRRRRRGYRSCRRKRFKRKISPVPRLIHRLSVCRCYCKNPGLGPSKGVFIPTARLHDLRIMSVRIHSNTETTLA